MNSRSAPSFDEARLRELAGDKVFARGRGYADGGHVALLSVSDGSIVAAVFGTNDYTVGLKRSGSGVSGHCSCPAYEDAGFCKHMVAAALAANEGSRQGDACPDRVGEIAGSLARLDRSQLEKLLLDMVASDWRSLRSLCFALGLDWEEDFD